MDLAEKLRRFAGHLRGGGSFSSPDAAVLIEEGSAEITRLQQEVMVARRCDACKANGSAPTGGKEG